MKHEQLLIVFAKNIVLGKAKTRLAKTIGDENAMQVYCRLVEITESASLKTDNADVHIYYSDRTDNDFWKGEEKFVQRGTDLGERMGAAFEEAFSKGYSRVIGIGADLPDLSPEVLNEALTQLKSHDTVFGPSDDGGYYLLGMTEFLPCIFENKPWSTETLLDETKKELKENNRTVALLPVLNDIDTIEDLIASSLKEEFASVIPEV